ncbi:MAG: hypothetical protein QM723_35395 [Myxococcaceae bacterium]
MTHSKKLIAAAIATLGLAVPAFAHGNDKAEGIKKSETVQLSSIPQAAQDTIKREAGSDVTTVSKATDKDGKTTYEADFTKDGKPADVCVKDDGSVVSRDTGMKHSEAKGRMNP